jgi:hypothetical protein
MPRKKGCGIAPWNKGLTSLTSELVKKNSEAKKKGKLGKCYICGKEIYIPKYRVRMNCCSLECTKEYKKKFSPKEEKNSSWKGLLASVGAIHKWVAVRKGKPAKCEVCGTDKKRTYHWANIDHSYQRNLEDYIRMCVSCHRKYDIENNNYRPGFYK